MDKSEITKSNRPIISCNLCKIPLTPDVRIIHKNFHKLSWAQIVKYGIFSYNESELKIKDSEDGYCPKCGAYDNGIAHSTIYNEELDCDIELLECSKCEELFFSLIIDDFESDLLAGELIKGILYNKRNYRRKPLSIDNKKVCSNCTYSTFRAGSTICTNIVRYNDEVVITNMVGDASSCSEFAMKTNKQKQEYVNSIKYFFGEGKITNVP
jgi:hypothetical protein